MELFSVACITCRAKIKVRHVSAIGQILACPRCGAMVQITPPSGWKPPADAAPPKPATPADAVRPETQPSSTGTSYVAEPVLDDPLSSSRRSPDSTDRRRSRRWIYIVGGLAAAAIIGFGIWSSFGGGEKDDPRELADKPAADPVGSTKPTTIPTAAPRASTPSVGTPGPVVAPSASPSASPSVASTAPPMPAPTMPAASAAATSAPAAVPSASATPTPTVPAPMPSATASATAPPVVAPPGVMPPKPAQPEDINVAERLQSPAAGFRFEQTKRRDALNVVAQLAGVAVDYDWDSLSPPEFGLSELVSTKADAETLQDVLEQLLESRKLSYSTERGCLKIGGGPDLNERVEIAYSVGDLSGGDAAQAKTLAGIVRMLIAADTWDSAGGAATIQESPDKLTMTQSRRVHRELEEFLARLREARGKPAPQPSTAPATRYVRARAKLETPLTMNFRPSASLAQVVDKLQQAAGITLTIDHPNLAEQGTDDATAVGIAADKHPLMQVLTALCEPRGWAWRVVDEQTMEITTRDALRRRLYVEFYDLRVLPADGSTPEQRMARWKLQSADAGWIDDGGGSGVMVYDAASGRLIVRQHQAGQFRVEQLIRETMEPPDPPKPGGAKPPTATATATPAAASAAPRLSTPSEIAPARVTP